MTLPHRPRKSCHKITLFVSWCHANVMIAGIACSPCENYITKKQLTTVLWPCILSTMETKRNVIAVPQEMLDKLKAIKAKTRINISLLVQEAIQDYFKKQGVKK